jgi:PAS domain S-box-containing protein
MERDDEEERLLRSVALKNAKSILLARQRAEEELVRAKEWLRVTLASIGDAVITTDTEGRVSSLNPVAELLTGWTAKDAQGEPLERVFQIVNEDSREPVENPALRSLREGKVVGLANHTVLISKDETERAIDDSAAPIKDEQGKIIGVVLIFRDVSERRQAEARFRQLADENARLVATLKESDRRKDEFLAMLAHELRNPLAPIRNGVQIFRAKAPPVKELQWATEVIDRQVNQMTRLVDDLLDLSRITLGKIELRKERVDLAAIVNSAVEASRSLIEKSGHELTVTISPQPIQLEADFTRLSQVLMNLLNNAAKYMDQAGHVWVTAEREDDGVLIRVKDTGIGIPTEMLPCIFDMFTQVDRSLERSKGGLGLGLTLVQRLVEMHGGTVEAHSEGAGLGSEFVVRLPATGADEDQGPAAGAAAEVAAPAALRILVVDDNQDAAESLGMLLGLKGNEVRTAHDGLEAVEAAAAFQPDVVLLDIGLPKLNGYEAARQIREQPGCTGVVLIALTGWGQDEDRRRSREAGFDHHMTKPVELADLQKLLADTLPSHSRRHQATR